MNIQFSFLAMSTSDALRDYVTEKIEKYKELLSEATSIRVDFKEDKSTKGVASDFEIDINIVFPNSLIRVQETGKNIYSIADKATDVLGRRIKKYHEKRNDTGGMPADIPETEDNNDTISDEYIDYVPKISKTIPIVDVAPLNQAEAIERMELSGRNQILFKDVSTGKISMIYKVNNEYILEFLKEEI